MWNRVERRRLSADKALGSGLGWSNQSESGLVSGGRLDRFCEGFRNVFGTDFQNDSFPTVPAPGTSVHIGRSSLFAMARSGDFGGPPFKTIVFWKVANFVRVEIRRSLILGLLENVLH